MPKYLIRRELPGAGALDAAALKSASAHSNAVLAELGPGIAWVHSYVTQDGLMCVYNARDEDIIREHARRSNIPCNEITRVAAIIDPVTGEEEP